MLSLWAWASNARLDLVNNGYTMMQWTCGESWSWFHDMRLTVSSHTSNWHAFTVRASHPRTIVHVYINIIFERLNIPGAGLMYPRLNFWTLAIDSRPDARFLPRRRCAKRRRRRIAKQKKSHTFQQACETWYVWVVSAASWTTHCVCCTIRHHALPSPLSLPLPLPMPHYNVAITIASTVTMALLLPLPWPLPLPSCRVKPCCGTWRIITSYGMAQHAT